MVLVFRSVGLGLQLEVRAFDASTLSQSIESFTQTTSTRVWACRLHGPLWRQSTLSQDIGCFSSESRHHMVQLECGLVGGGKHLRLPTRVGQGIECFKNSRMVQLECIDWLV